MYSLSSFSEPVLIEENGRPVKTVYKKEARNSNSFRSLRKVGVGFGAAGTYGLIGTSFELNFSPKSSLMANFGLGKNYRTFGLSLKQMVGGESFSPYLVGGFSRWYSVGENGPINRTNPGFLAEKFLSKEEKQEGKFSETILYPGFGLQYHQLTGEWAGASLYAEVLFLVDIDDFTSAPAGTLGYMYYF